MFGKFISFRLLVSPKQTNIAHGFSESHFKFCFKIKALSDLMQFLMNAISKKCFNAINYHEEANLRIWQRNQFFNGLISNRKLYNLL